MGDDPDAKVKFLAAEALRGVGGLVLDKNGKRFANELGRRDYVTGEMWKNKPPFRLCLNKAAYALIQMLEKVAEKTDRARIITKARAHKLLTNPSSGACVGLIYEKGGKDEKEYGPVILASGGFGADFTQDSLLAQYRPDLMHLPTTNGEHCTGDGIKMGE